MKGKKLFLFFIGLFSMTQIRVIGSIGISELVVFVLAPFYFMQNYALLKHDGFLPAIYLSLFSLVGCCIASFYNDIHFAFFLRGFASTYSIFAAIVCYHHLLRNNFTGIKWFLIGLCLTGILSTFVFQRSVESMLYAGGETGIEVADQIMSSPIYWIQRLSPIVALPYRAWYFSTPLAYSVLAPLAMAAFCILSSSSGRSAALGLIAGSAIIFIGKKSIAKMRNISRNILIYSILAVGSIWVANFAYRIAATSGTLGDKAQAKYEAQTQGSSSVLKLLMGGRLAFFIGLYAGCKQPIIGYGPWAIDRYGYTEQFLSKYGTAEDYDNLVNSYAYMQGKTMYIPAHSHIVLFWISNGILGLLFWLYVLWKIFEYFRGNLAVVPQWYGLLAAGTPPILWDIFFSPYTSRMYFPFFFVMILFANAIAKGKIPLPHETINEVFRRKQ